MFQRQLAYSPPNPYIAANSRQNGHGESRICDLTHPPKGGNMGVSCRKVAEILQRNRSIGKQQSASWSSLRCGGLVYGLSCQLTDPRWTIGEGANYNSITKGVTDASREKTARQVNASASSDAGVATV